MTSSVVRRHDTFLRLQWVFAAVVVASAWMGLGAQSRAPANRGEIHGVVRDEQGHPVAGVTVRALSHGQETQSETSADGGFEFSGLAAGEYGMRAAKEGCDKVHVALGEGESKQVDLKLTSKGCELGQVAFFDDPKFTVAGVSDATSPGGHGSNTVLRTTESLARETASLSAAGKPKGNSELATARGFYARGEYGQARTATEALLQRQPTAEAHHLLAEIDEKAGDSLGAVHEYQKAAEMDPSEANVFDWGSELLLHRALEPATEVFTHGHNLYPGSARMLIGLGVVWYARGSYDQAARALGEAADLNENDPTPYLFMGKIVETEVAPPKEILERMTKLAKVLPENAQAQYYCGLSLWKGRRASEGLEKKDEALAHLQRAVELDPKLGSAWAAMGVVHAASGELQQAIADYEKGIAASPELPEAHYRLAQLYGRLGEKAKRQEQLEIYEQTSKNEEKQLERDRRAIQDFVTTQQDPKNQSK